MDDQPRSAADEVDWPSPARAWWGLTVLTVALLVATVDRSVISLLIEPIKHDLRLSDTQISLLVGFAFVMFYAVLGLPIARLADVYSRRAIIGIGIAFWSCATVACGAAGGFWQLFWARVGVGAGESSFAPATYSILTDSFPPEQLPRVMAVNSLGFVGGQGLANLAGGAAIAAVAGLGMISLPLFGDIRPWQVVFIIVGLPGFLIALAMVTVQEPRRRGLIVGAGRGKAIPISAIFRFLANDWRTYVPIFVALAVKVLLSFGAGLWTPTLFIRTWGWSAPQIAYALGIMTLVLSPLGLWLGGAIAERLARRGDPEAYMRIVLWVSVAVMPLSISFPLVSSPWLALCLFGVNICVASIGVGPGNAALQLITPNEMRSQVRALYQFVFNVIGYALGPVIVALFTDYLFGGEADLRYSMALLAAVLSPLAIAITWFGVRPYGRSYARAMERLA